MISWLKELNNAIFYFPTFAFLLQLSCQSLNWVQTTLRVDSSIKQNHWKTFSSNKTDLLKKLCELFFSFRQAGKSLNSLKDESDLR